jgi:O-acetyl-ADP-ribose deacetylase (regulator of RNase III)
MGELRRSFDDLTKTKSKPMLPIGEAIITSLEEYPKYKTCYLITAPTMVYPMDIQGTDNPKKAFLACLNVLKDHKNVTQLICPGLGTGVGGITGEECAKQIFDAMNEFVQSK